MSNDRFWKIGRLALSAASLVLGAAFAPVALAQYDTTVTAATGQECPVDRFYGAGNGGTPLNCTANEYIVTATSMSNTIATCHLGDQISVDVELGITSSSTTRYDVGYFVNENGGDPNLAGQSCSVATFPLSGMAGAWFDASGGSATNTCGDYNPNFSTTNLVQGITVTCASDANGNLAIPYMLTYAQNAGGSCTGPADSDTFPVSAGTTSKCKAGTVPVTNVTVTYNVNPTCSFTGAGDGFTIDYNGIGTWQKVFTITNFGDDAAGMPDSNSIGFSDQVPASLTVGTATCGNPQNGAACPVAPLMIDAGTNTVSGNIPTLPGTDGAMPTPHYGSVDITITGTYTPGATTASSNTVQLINNDPTAIITPMTWVSTCGVDSTLPVKLQSFDVH